MWRPQGKYQQVYSESFDVAQDKLRRGAKIKSTNQKFKNDTACHPDEAKDLEIFRSSRSAGLPQDDGGAGIFDFYFEKALSA